MDLSAILTAAVQKGASDVHLKGGMPPLCRLHGALLPFKDAPRLDPDQLSRMAVGIMTQHQLERFKHMSELDMSYSLPGLGRFRVNIFQQRGMIGMVFRAIPINVLTIDELGLPPVIKQIALEQRGLVLVTGATGSGKSTTLAAMIDFINSNRACHVVTIEDPIEFVFRDRKSIINQREVGVDTMSFPQAMVSALRQDPDVILVGEMRDIDTTRTALIAGETGHLVLSTLHTVDSTETITRVVTLFEPHEQDLVRLQLGSIIRAIIGCRLVPTKDGKRVAALEVLRNTPRIREMIEHKERLKEIPEAIAEGTTAYGMQTFDQALMGHLKAEKITYEEALRQSSNPSNFALRARGISSTSDAKWDGFDRQN